VLYDEVEPRRARSPGLSATSPLWRLARQIGGRLSWGVADQAMSSISNFAVNIYIARTLGAVQYGAFGLAYVTYGFALNASRGLATDPLLVRFSGAEAARWRRATAACTGTAATTGLVTGACVLAATGLLHGAARESFLALGLTLPLLLLQDSWRFAFFARGSGGQAFLNDSVWALALIPLIVILRLTGRANVFWFVFAWGLAAGLAAAVGPVQAKVMPRLTGTWTWVSQHRDLGMRYLIEGTSNSGAAQVRNYGIGFMLGLAVVGYVQAASTLIGPIMIMFYGMNLVTLPEAARILRRSPRWLPLFCVLVSIGLMVLAVAWGAVLLVALPHGLGHLMLGSLWARTYPLVVPSVIGAIGACATAGATTGLHALGASQRSMGAMLLWALNYVACGLIGALTDGLTGVVVGAAIASWVGAVLFWWQLKTALRDYKEVPAGTVFWPGRQHSRSGQHS